MKGLLHTSLEKKLGEISDGTLQVLSRCTESYEVNQGKNIANWLEQHDIVFVEVGALKFTECDSEITTTLHLLTEGMFFLNVENHDKIPEGKFQLIATKPSTIAIIRHLKINDYLLRNYELNRIYAVMMDEIVMREKIWKSIIMLRSAKEKYQEIQQSYPNILQSFKTKDVANFLGITAGTMNKAKKQKS
ncbi:MAG: hypothetical protein WBP58_12745 [Chitinophagaceae bacterium]